MGNSKALRGTRWPGGGEGLANPHEEKRLGKALEGELRHFPRGERGFGTYSLEKEEEKDWDEVPGAIPSRTAPLGEPGPEAGARDRKSVV